MKTKKESVCTSTKVKLCNGAFEAVKKFQDKYEKEHGGIYLSIPRAINMLLSGIKIEDKCNADKIKDVIVRQ